MKIRSLECLCAIVASDFNLSRAAKRLYASQPAVTRQIQLLEQELGFDVLIRHGNKVSGLTQEGRIVYERACNILHETRQLSSLSLEMRDHARGKLVVATTQVHARYTLLPSIKKFRVSHPQVVISIMSGDPGSIAKMVATGQADLGLSADAPLDKPELVVFPCYQTRRLIITPKSHPLTRSRSLSLKLLAQYPLIVYDRRFSSGWRVLDAFEKENITPNITLTATDADSLKAYVAAGLGVAVIQGLAFDPQRDHDLDAIVADHLFECPMTCITLRRGAFLRGYTLNFLKLLAPKLDLSAVEAACRSESPSGRRRRPDFDNRVDSTGLA